MCIQELFAGVGVLHLENQSQQDLTSSDPDQFTPDQDKEVMDGQEEDDEDTPVAHLSAEISRLKDEAFIGREKIKDLQEQVCCSDVQKV